MASLRRNRPIYLQVGSSTQLVEQLRAISPLGTEVSLPRFMRGFATQFSDRTHGLVVRTDTTDNFVADLVAHGWLKIII